MTGVPPILFMDDRQTEPSNRIHALVIGISDYSHLPNREEASGREETLGLTKVECGALSAWRFATWLRKADEQRWLPQRLATIRMLLAPSQAEVDAEPALRPYRDALASAAGPTAPRFAQIMQAAVEWRHDCAKTRDGVAYLYFCGHGILRDSSTTTILAQDFAIKGQPALDNAFDVNNLVNGMAPSAAFPEIARTQFYLLDCCQTIAEGLRTSIVGRPRDILSERVPSFDDRNRPIFRSAWPGGAAPAPRGAATPFCLAVCDALENGAASQRTTPTGDVIWPVTVGDLVAASNRSLRRIGARSLGYAMAPQEGVSDLTVIMTAKADPPLIAFNVRLHPAGKKDSTRIHFSRGRKRDVLVLTPDKPYPYSAELHPGQYELEPVGIPDGPGWPTSELILTGDVDQWTVRIGS